MTFLLETTHCPGLQYWLNSKGQQNAPQETEIESYVVGGIKQDIKNDTFAGYTMSERELIDDAFYVEQTRFMWKSVLKDTGKDFLFGAEKQHVIDMSRWHLKCLQDGTLEQYTRVVGRAVVDGKLSNYQNGNDVPLLTLKSQISRHVLLWTDHSLSQSLVPWSNVVEAWKIGTSESIGFKEDLSRWFDPDVC